MRPSWGFTLIELLIALCIFAILASITASSLYNAFHTASRLMAQADQLNNIQLALSILEQDSIQTIDRPVRGNQMVLFPAFIGRADYLELTRTGNSNPNSLEKRSTLKRIALLCQKGRLIRRSWDSLDSIDRSHYEDSVLLTELSECYFSYLNHQLQSFPEWRAQTESPLPKAIEVHLKLKNGGSMQLLYLIPGAHYGTKKQPAR